MSKQEINRLKAVNRQQLEHIQKQEARHKAELDKRSRLEWKAQQEKLEKLKGAERTIDSKEKEIRLLKEHLSAKELECSNLHQEVQSLRNANLSPSSSMDDISQVGLSKRERDMAMRNSELSYRIRVLEWDISKLKGTKQTLEQKLSTTRQELNIARQDTSPLRESNFKLQSQIDELNSHLRSRENKMNQLSKQMWELKSNYQHLQEDYDKQDRRLYQKNNQMLKCESQMQRLKSRNQKLSEELNQVKDKLKDMEEAKLREQIYFISSMHSPTPTISDDDHLSGSSSSVHLKEQLDQLEFDKDEIAANYSELEAKYESLQSKYSDLKKEYKNAREKHKGLQNLYEESQEKLKQENSDEIKKNAARDILRLEREVQLLHSSKEDKTFDEEREKLTVLALETQLNEYQEKIGNLESFIIKEDKSMMMVEMQWKEEMSRLSHALFSLPATHPSQYDKTEASQNSDTFSSDVYDGDNSGQPHSNEESAIVPVSSLDPVDIPDSSDIPSSTHQQYINSNKSACNAVDAWSQVDAGLISQSQSVHTNLQQKENNVSVYQIQSKEESNQEYDKNKMMSLITSVADEVSDSEKESIQAMEKKLHDKNLTIKQNTIVIEGLTKQVDELQQQLSYWTQHSTTHVTTQTDLLLFQSMESQTDPHKEKMIGGIKLKDKTLLQDEDHLGQGVQSDVEGTCSLQQGGYQTDLSPFHSVQVDMTTPLQHQDCHNDFSSQGIQVDMTTPSLHQDGYHTELSSQGIQIDMAATPSLHGYQSNFSSQGVQAKMETTPSPPQHDHIDFSSSSQGIQVDMVATPSLHQDDYHTKFSSQNVQVDTAATPSLHQDGYHSDISSQGVQFNTHATPSLHQDGYHSDISSQEVQANMEATPSLHHDGYHSDISSQGVQANIEATPSLHQDGHHTGVQVNMEETPTLHQNNYYSDFSSQGVQVDMATPSSLHQDGHTTFSSQKVQVDMEATSSLHQDGYHTDFPSQGVQAMANMEASLVHHDNYPGTKMFSSNEEQMVTGGPPLVHNETFPGVQFISQEVQVSIEGSPWLHQEDNASTQNYASQEVQVEIGGTRLQQNLPALQKMLNKEVQISKDPIETADSVHEDRKRKFHSQEVQVDSQEVQFDSLSNCLRENQVHSKEIQTEERNVHSKEVQTQETNINVRQINSAVSQVEQNDQENFFIVSLQKKNAELERNVMELKEKLKRAEINKLQNDADMEEKDKRIQQLQMEVHKLHTDMTHVEKLSQARVHDLKTRGLKMESLLEEKKKRVKSLQSQIENQEHHIATLQDRNFSDGNHTHQNKIVRDKDTQIHTLKSHLEQLKKELQQTESQQLKEVALLRDQVKQTKSELKESKMKLEFLEKELEATKRRNIEKDLVMEEKNISINQLELELGNIILQSNSQAANDVCQSLLDNTEAQKLAHDINRSFKKLDSSIQSDDSNVMLIMKDLKSTVEKLLQFFVHGVLPLDSSNGISTAGNEVAVMEESSQFVHNDQTSSLLRLFVVVMDYDPQSLCITGQPELELYLLSGTIVIVLGEMDDRGYYTAQHNNREGLVPANFVQEIEVKDREQMLSRAGDFNELLFSRCSPSWGDSKRSNEGTTIQESYPKVVEDSASPHSVSVRETAMTTTDSDLGDIQNGETSLCEEHQMFLAICDYNPITSSSSTHPEFELSFKEGDLIKIFGEMMPDKYYIGQLNGKRGFVAATLIIPVSTIKTTSPCLSTSKRMTALYDYYPEKHSPNPNPEMELSFHAGDVITIYGTMHEDGFYTGHIKEKIGLVPSNFIKESN